jgi:nitrogen-specific signal transduction histidine kinase/CheY-like chemotaxis protein
MSERKLAEERLLQAQKLESVSLLAGGVAHDFNNLLATIMGSASLLAGDVAAREQEHVDAILQASQRAADLTRQLLAYAGKGRYVIEPVDLSAMVRDLGRLLRASIPKRVKLVEKLAEDLPAIQADRGQIQQIVMNLVLNAAEAMPETGQGEIGVRTSAEELNEAGTVVDAVTGQIMSPGQYVCLEVRDTGSGIDGPTRARIFDPFFTTKFAGRGLGLAAAAGVVKAHRGAILVESAPGKGATFRVFLPASRESRPVEPGPRSRDLRGSGTVLVVDDEPMVRGFIRKALSRCGYEVLTASDGHNAVQVFENHSGPIDLVLLDLMMPVLGGAEAIARIRAKSPDIKVILMSGYSELEAERLFSPAGVGTFLQKPFTFGSLAQQVKTVLGNC